MTTPPPTPAEPGPQAPPPPPAPAVPPAVPPTRRALGARLDRAFSRGFATVTGRALGPYQTAVIRIGFAATWLFFLLRELPHRHELYGPDSPWSWTLAERLIDGNKAFTVLMWTDSPLWFEFVYAFAVLASLGLLVGWRTRTMSVFFMVGVLSLQNRSVFMGDGGDNVIHLMAMYLILTRCGQVWSLDARRSRRRAGTDDADVPGLVLWGLTAAALLGVTVLGLLSTGWALCFWLLLLAHALWWTVQRYGPGEPRGVLDALVNLLHNGALLVIMVEVCLIYATAGWYKVQGSRWQDGTAVYYPMHLDYFAPWPALSQVLGSSGLVILLLTYGTVIVQVAFPFTLFNRRVKNVLLAVMILEHASIAVILGLPFFSLAMIAADAVFLPTVFLVWLGARVGGLARRVRPGGPSAAGARQGVPPPRGGDRPDPAAPGGQDVAGASDSTVPARR
ncbi:HTTM domain-containing protein [Streptomyces sp. 549]|uniref:HTTM domain-containing protein n=1 Tax=Streptomyces sp. 549 TaxID=3049076 RepID=UPI0024C3F405|nr:HTTM domain-containing protein [Streptomyces sp. 549]MDK1473231.1 HTTM domain-containing protein [Streptomyces sp. 549]